MKKLLALFLLTQSALAQEKILEVEMISLTDQLVAQTKNLKAFSEFCATNNYSLSLEVYRLLVNNKAVQKTLDDVLGDEKLIAEEMESAFNDYQKEYFPNGMPKNKEEIQEACESGYVMGIGMMYFGKHHGAHHFELLENYLFNNEESYESYELLAVDSAGHVLSLEEFIKKEAYSELKSALVSAYKEYCPTEIKDTDDLLKPAGFSLDVENNTFNFLYREDAPNDCLGVDMILSIPLNQAANWFQHAK